MNKHNVLKTKIILCINISHLLRIKKLICYISHFCFFNSATLENSTCCQKTTRQNSSETAWKEYRLTFSYQTWGKNTNIRNGCHCYYCFGQILRRLRQVNADQIKTSRRVSPLHSVDGRRPVRVLLLGWNFSFQLVPQWFHLLRRIICSCRYFIHILNYFYSFFSWFCCFYNSLPPPSSQSSQQGSVWTDQPRTSFCRLHFCTCCAAPHCHELHRINGIVGWRMKCIQGP